MSISGGRGVAVGVSVEVAVVLHNGVAAAALLLLSRCCW